MRETLEQTADLEKLHPIIKDLPLEKCSFERNPITREWGWLAPKGFTFKVTGQFVVDSDLTDPAYPHWSHPLSSVDLIKSEYPELYKKLMEESDGDEKFVLEELEREQYDDGVRGLPESFIGKWLTIDRDSLRVKGYVELQYAALRGKTLRNITPGTENVTSVAIYDPGLDLDGNWIQDFAEIKVGHSKIELVEIEEQDSLIIVDPKQVSDYPNGSLQKDGVHVVVFREPTDEEKQRLKEFKLKKGQLYIVDPKTGCIILFRDKRLYSSGDPEVRKLRQKVK